MATDSEAVCVFVNDSVNEAVLKQLALQGVQVIALRCAGFNNVDLKAVAESNIRDAQFHFMAL